MDEYTRLKNEIDAYLEMPDVELTDQQISAYDLYRIVNDKFKKLREINFNQKIIKDINRGLGLRRISAPLKKEKGVSHLECNSVTLQCNGEKSSIDFLFISPSNPSDIWRHVSLYICKEVDNDEIYFGSNTSDKNFVAKYYDQISEMFITLEEFSKLYQGGVGSCGKDSTQVFSDDFIDVTFNYDTYGRTDISIDIKEGADPQGIYNRKWFQRQSLSDYVKENTNTILRKIPINIDELNYTTKTIVESCLSKINVPQKKLGGK